MKKKLSKEELEEINSARHRMFDLKLHLADITMAELKLQEEKKGTISEMALAKKHVDDVNERIVKKYGEGVKINFGTGEIAS